jgi:hypothetical protein
MLSVDHPYQNGSHIFFVGDVMGKNIWLETKTFVLDGLSRNELFRFSGIGQLTKDEKRLLVFDYSGITVFDAWSCKRLAFIRTDCECNDGDIASDGTCILVKAAPIMKILCRRRPEYWWGLAWLPEFWLSLVFSGAFIWSVWRDRRELPGSTK